MTTPSKQIQILKQKDAVIKMRFKKVRVRSECDENQGMIEMSNVSLLSLSKDIGRIKGHNNK